MDAQVRWVCVPEEAIFDRNLQQEQRFPNSLYNMTNLFLRKLNFYFIHGKCPKVTSDAFFLEFIHSDAV